MNRVLAEARPLADVMFEREWASGDWSTPERRARLEQQLRNLVGQIADPNVRAHYERDIRQRLYTAWGARSSTAPVRVAAGGAPGAKRPTSGRPYPAATGFRAGGAKGRSGRFGPPDPTQAVHAAASSALMRSNLVAGGTAAPPYREALMMLTLLTHPWLLEEHAEALSGLTLTSEPLHRLKNAMLSVLALDIPLDSRELRSQLDALGAGRIVDLVERTITHRSDKFAEPDANRDDVEAGWRHALALHERHVDLRRALEAAERDWQHDGNETALARICEIQRQIAFCDVLGDGEFSDDRGSDGAGGLDGGSRG